MTTDATGHGTRDTGHTQRPALRASYPDTTHPGVPSTEPAAERDTGHGTRDITRDTVPQPTRDTLAPDARDVPQEKKPSLAGRLRERYAASRASREAARASRDDEAGQRDIMEAASRAARDAERDTQRDALSRIAASRRGPSRNRPADQRDDAIAPIPRWMRIAGVWLDRTFGAVPLVAPLIVSGHFTMHVFTDNPLNVLWTIALCITLALEGGVWKLSRIYEKTLLEGDSTVGIRMVIGLYLLLISGMIYGHAYYLAWRDASATGNASASQLALDWSKWAPAAGVAVMSFLGVMVWSKQARYQHRVKLRELNMVDPRAPKFAAMAWALHFPETFGALRHAVKYRISSPTDAVTDRRLYRAAGRPPIWPIPAGFSWINGTLLQIDPLEGRDVHDVVPLPTGHRPAVENGTPARTINGTSRETVPQLPAGQPTERDTANGTRDTGHGTASGTGHGTRDGQPGAGHPAAQRDGNGTDAAAGDGTRDTNGTRDTSGTAAGRLLDEDSAALKDSGFIMIVAEAYPAWATQPKPPSVREIIAAVHAYRQRTEGGKFASREVASRIQKAIIRCRENPALFDLVRQIEGPDTTTT